MKYLVTGSSGLIGSQAVAYFHTQGRESNTKVFLCDLPEGIEEKITDLLLGAVNDYRILIADIKNTLERGE